MPCGRRGALGPERHASSSAAKVRNPGTHSRGTNSMRDPRQLQDGDADRVSARRGSAVGIRGRRSQPLRDQGQPHHDVAADRGHVRGARLEHRRHARRQNQRAGNLHEHGEAVRHIVAVVRRGEPGEVHPGPPDGEEDHQIADEALRARGLRRWRGAVRWLPARSRPRRRGRRTVEGRRGAVRLRAASAPSSRAAIALRGRLAVPDGSRLRHRTVSEHDAARRRTRRSTCHSRRQPDAS